jgi:hypothetical protein
MKRIILLLVLVLILTTFVGCKELDESNIPTTTLRIRTEIPSTSVEPTISITVAPTATKAPIATVEPGKETYSGGILDENVGIWFTYMPESGRTDHRMLNESLAIQFFATASFDKIQISCPSYSDNEGTITIELFKWQGAYFDTINREKNPAVASIDYVDYKDNATLTLSVDIQQDGEYLLYLTTPNKEKQVGVWAKYDVNESELMSRAYYDDIIWEGGSFGPTIHYTKTPNVLFGPLQDSGL